jgi:hypothetical protein
MIEYMRLCQKYKIHLLSDEIYALTTFPTDDIREPIPFTSLLSIDTEGIIDPSLCHVIHGMSKVLSLLSNISGLGSFTNLQDFCANGLRFGTLISQSNPILHKAMSIVGYPSLLLLPSSSL